MGLDSAALGRGLLGALLLPLLLLPSAPRRDLDVALPAGSPLDWARSFPAVSPGRSPFARSPAREGDEERSRATVRPRRLEVRLSSAPSLVRVLTWDLAAHLAWIGPRERGAQSGAASLEPDRAAFGEPLYWLSLAPLLRLLLHPSDLPRAEVRAHLVELGRTVEGVLYAVSAERGLRDDVAAIRRLIAPGKDGAPEPPVGETARERMFARFTREALLRDHPFDPEGSFGRELFLFPDEVLPHLVRAARSAHALLRRNAAAALARFETRAAAAELVRLAAETEDPVVLVRACAGIGRFRGPLDRSALLARLKATEEPVLSAALAGALARSGVAELRPWLLARTRAAWEQPDSDLLLSCLLAWTELAPPRPDGAEARLFEELDRDLRSDPRAFRPKGPKAGVQADRPDRPETRARVLRQLVDLLRARSRPDDALLATRLLDLFDPPAAEAEPGEETAPRPPFPGDSSLGGVAPAARIAYVETLRYLGDEGLEVLAHIVGDPRVEDALRGQALGLLPYGERRDQVERLFHGEPAVGAGLRELVLRRMVADNDPRWPGLALELLRECARLEPGGGSAPLRSLYLTAVRSLSERGTLAVRDLTPLLVHVRAPRQVRASLGQAVRARLEDLVGSVAAGVAIDRLKPGVAALIDFLWEERVPAVTEDSRAELRAYVLGALRGVRKHPGDRAYRRTVVADVFERLLGYRLAMPRRETGEFEVSVLLEEEILLALGRTRRPEACEPLLALLGDDGGRLRAHTLLALGMVGVRESAPRLARHLLDPDPLVRLCAYESLRHLTGKTLDVDWMFAPRAERDRAAEEYFGWLQGK